MDSGNGSDSNRECDGASDWLLWQLADSAFPTGGFAHSAGLEAAWQHGEVRDRDELIGFLDASLWQLGLASLPYVSQAFQEPESWPELDAHCDVFTSNHVANRASRLQGRAFIAAIRRIYLPEIESADPGHFAPAFGACLNRIGASAEQTRRLLVFSHLRGLLAAAVRLNIVGPMEAQQIQHRFSRRAEEVARSCGSLTIAELAQTAPLHDLWQASQDRLYSRLFQS